MKKLLLSIMTILTVSLYLSPVANAQQPCSANFQYSIGTPGPNGATVVSFFDSSYAVGTITSWQWTFSNGAASGAQNPVITVNGPTTFVACLTISAYYQNVLCTSTYCDTINVNNGGPLPCNSNFSWVASPQGVQFAGATGANVSWSWSFGDGSAGSGANVFHPYSAPGNYTVCLTVVEGSGVTCTSCQTVTVLASGSCQAYFTSATTPGTTLATFTNQSQGNATYFYWNFGDGTSSYLQNPTHAYNAPGSYYVCLTIIDSVAACTDTYCDTLVIGGGVLCDPSFSVQSAPAATVFMATMQNNASYTWDFGDGSTGTGGPAMTHVYAAAGTYTACLTVTTSNGQTCTSCQTVVVPTSSGCQAYYTVTNVPGTVVYNFTNQSQGNATYFYWNFGDGTTSNLQNPSHTFSAPGFYNVCLTIIDSSSGCTDTYCDSLAVGNGILCNANFTTQVAPAAVVFIGSDPTNTSWSWNFGDGSTGTGGPTATHVYAAPGTYNVCLTVTSSNGQTCTSCQSVTVQNGSGCSSNYALYPDSLIPHMYYAYNLATGAAPITYTWSWGDGTSSNVAYPTHTYASAGSYTICLTITDGNGCTSTTCYPWQLLRLSSSSVPVTINVLPGTTGLIEQELINTMSVYPNPASDLISTGFSLAKESAITLDIVNLAGQKVFSLPSTNYTAGSHEIRIDASDLPEGMYMIEIQSEGFRSHQKVIVQ